MSTIEHRSKIHGGYKGVGTCAVCGCSVMDAILACTRCVDEVNAYDLTWGRWLINDVRSERYRNSEFDKHEICTHIE